jgi:hypothetical protein
MKKILFSILLGLALVATSCDNLLDIQQKGVISQDDFYKSDEDAVAARADMYVNFLTNVAGTAGIYNSELMILNYSADDVLSAGGDNADHGDFRIFDEFSYDNAGGVLKGLYNNYVNAIYHTNLVISNFSTENRNQTEPKFTSAFTKQIVEEARVMRAYLHMMMALSFYAPNIVDRLLEPDELPVQATDQKQVLDWVISECEKALNSNALPVRASTSDKNSTAIMTRGFAQFVAGKAAMFNDNPAKAREHLGNLINEGKYALVPSEDFWTNFHVAGDGNSEKIFEPNFLRDDNFTNNGWGSGQPIIRGRWMIADVLCWRTGSLASTPTVCEKIPGAGGGWNGGAIQEGFAKKFLEHDGKSPRRLATFLTADEWLYEMDWSGSAVNDGSLDAKKADPKRGIADVAGLFSHGPYFEWKNMVYHNPPKILTGGKTYPADNIDGLGANSNQKNFNVARYAEALLLYAEACIGADETNGLKALNEVQKRSGSGKISTSLTINAVMEEKQYEMWFENTRFHDLVRWAKKGYVSLNDIFNTSGIHERVPVIYDAFFTDGEPEHRLYVKYTTVNDQPFEVGKHEYFPFPRDIKIANPEMKDVLGWAYLNAD